jgi:hypothetical protein
LYFPSRLRQTTLSGWDRGAVWPPGDGNIKVQYTAGFTVIPDDIAQACQLLAAQLNAAAQFGARMMSENLGEYGYTILQHTDQYPDLTSVPILLAPYRDIVI